MAATQTAEPLHNVAVNHHKADRLFGQVVGRFDAGSHDESAVDVDVLLEALAQEASYFEWSGCEDSSPKQLADLFEQSFSEMLTQSRDADQDYVNWYADMLTQTEPAGLVYAFAHWDYDKSVLHVIGKCKQETIPLPPPGRAQVRGGN